MQHPIPKATGERRSREKHVHLVNKRTLVSLTIVSMSALWLVAPSKSKLMNLIEKSDSPEVTSAFLRPLYDKNKEDPEVMRELAESYFAMGDYDKSLAVLHKMLEQDKSNDKEKTYALYAKALIQKANLNAPGSETARKKLAEYLIAASPSSPAFARELADFSLQLGMPARALSLLLPYQNTAITSPEEIKQLALQSGNYRQAISMEHHSYNADPSLANLKNLLSVYIKANESKAGLAWVDSHIASMQLNTPTLNELVYFAHQSGEGNAIFRFSSLRADHFPEYTNLLDAAKWARATGHHALAERYFEDALSKKKERSTVKALHQLYSWQGDIPGALKMSKALMQMSPTSEELHQGIKEAQAVSDLPAESQFYQALAHKNELKHQEYHAWIDSTEKAFGTGEAIKEVSDFPESRHNPVLISHLARLYGYQSQWDEVAKLWPEAIKSGNPTHAERLRYADAFIGTMNPAGALSALTEKTDWQVASPDYLNMVSELAWETGNRDLAEQSQDALLRRNDTVVNTYRYMRTHSPVNFKKLEDYIKLYRRSGNLDVLLQIAEEARTQGNTEAFDRLLKIAMDSGKETYRLIYLEALADIDNGRQFQAKVKLKQVLADNPVYAPAISVYIWQAILSGDHNLTQALYDKYSKSLGDNDSLWPVFAGAAEYLGYTDAAAAWFGKLLKVEPNSAELLLAYANLKEKSGDSDMAYRLRLYVASKLTDKLFALPDGHVTYRSLVSLFAGADLAEEMTKDALLDKATRASVAQLIGFISQTGSEYQVQQTSAQFDRLGFAPDTAERLSLAISSHDKPLVKSLLKQVAGLSPSVEIGGYQSIGESEEAWNSGQRNLGATPYPQLNQDILKAYATLHPYFVEAVKTRYSTRTDWNQQVFDFEYFTPSERLDLGDTNNWYWSMSQQHTAPMASLNNKKLPDQTSFSGKFSWNTTNLNASVGLSATTGIGDTLFGVTGDADFTITPAVSLSIDAGIGEKSDSSKLLSVAGKQNHIQLGLGLHPTNRESLSLSTQVKQYQTRFGDDIGTEYSLSATASEQLFAANPAWQIYGSFTRQTVDYNKGTPDGFNQWLNSPAGVIGNSAFISDAYQRIAIGQRLENGVPGLPGATVPAPRYWLDTSVGYNPLEKKTDFTLSAGIGMPIFGSDELSMTSDWQTTDRSGGASLGLSVGYSFNF
ncbi:tetratricopeptide repeat protein [Parasalinivibrio latis]|uniref:tetratricopeptide repeat protein n=1 Tax=Parasalinivibrio latis TaxID=2952610 RepID=UPI0030E013D2